MTSTTEQMIQCVKREIVMRERVYQRWVESGKMKQPQADREIETMRDVLAVLQAKAEAERLI